nr:ABC transporter ATP-binding protein [Trichocoleus sp. FACHB-46]
MTGVSDTVIRVENLGKKYIIGHQQQGRSRYTALRDVLADGTKSIGRRILNPFAQQPLSPTKEEFWALKDVSFEIKQGDRVGIIGRNGAGKSTLLKLLSRITEPTKGRISIKGRVASLLEVGTGFHPELTGRENIYLNGAILGMSKAEIKKKFDEIVDFAEVEKFLDTPVKYYSSGMYVRLAFAVAAYLEPEVLVIDEVLAVGDADFQKKCLGKMEDAGKTGRTILFVSHNMGAITQLCTKALHLSSGKMLQLGSVNSVVANYLNSTICIEGEKQLHQNGNEVRRFKKFFFKRVSITNHDSHPTIDIDVRHPFFIKLQYESTVPLNEIELSVRIDTSDGRPVLTSLQSDYAPEKLSMPVTLDGEVDIKFPGMFLMPGSYLVTIAAHKPLIEMFDIHEHVLSFNILETGTTFAKYEQHHNIGVVIVDLPWLHISH